MRAQERSVEAFFNQVRSNKLLKFARIRIERANAVPTLRTGAQYFLNDYLTKIMSKDKFSWDMFDEKIKLAS